MRCVLVNRANGVDEVSVILQRNLRVEDSLETKFCKRAEGRDIVLVRDGIHVNEVGTVRSGEGIDCSTECEVVEVVDQSAEDRGIVRGKVEGSRVCFLYDRSVSGVPTVKPMTLQPDRAYLELPTEEFAEVLRLDPQDGLVHLPLLVATCDGEVGEESFWQETVAH